MSACPFLFTPETPCQLPAGHDEPHAWDRQPATVEPVTLDALIQLLDTNPEIPLLASSDLAQALVTHLRRIANEHHREFMRLRGWLERIAPRPGDPCLGMDECGCYMCAATAALAGEPVPS